VLVLAYSGLWLTAANIASTGMPTGSTYRVHLAPLRQAAKLFPLNAQLRQQPARFAVEMGSLLPPEIALAEVDHALKFNPYALASKQQTLLNPKEKP
jgi:hypothetical protein